MTFGTKNITVLSLVAILLLGVDTAVGQQVYQLWENGNKPYYKENKLVEYEQEFLNTQCVFNITEPTLTIYKARGKNTGKAVVIIPGGGYGLVAMYHEGYDVAERLAANGITAAVLKYRLPNPESSTQPHLVPIADTRRALQLVRDKAAEYNLNTELVGLMGFSAGSHLATVASVTKSEKQDENPNFSALIYGVTNLSEANLKWLEEKLYYRKLTEQEKDQNRLLDLVAATTPPAFLVHAYDDDVCLITESTAYAKQLQEHEVSVETHFFTKGGHGFGLGRKEDGTDQWIDLFINWLGNNVH